MFPMKQRIWDTLLYTLLYHPGITTFINTLMSFLSLIYQQYFFIYTHTYIYKESGGKTEFFKHIFQKN